MIQIRFKSLEPSELAREIAVERIQGVVDKFPDLQRSRIHITLEMENSPVKAGPDLFTVRVVVSGGRYEGISISKSEDNLYKAMSEVVDHLQEKLNRFGDKARVIERKRARSVFTRWQTSNG